MGGTESMELRSMVEAAVEQEVGARLREITGRLAALEARVAGAADPGGGGAPVAVEPAESAEPAESKDISPASEQDGSRPLSRLSYTLRLEDVEDGAAREWTYALRRSIWDAALFIGVPAVGSAGSVFLVIGSVSNILLQLIFAIAISARFGQLKELPSVEDAWEWRESHGHQFSNIITSTRTSLVRAICSGKAATLTISSWQHEVYTSICDYSGTDPLGIPLGALLCSAVLFSWALSICQELNGLWGFGAAVLHLPRADTTKVDKAEGELTLASCTRCRKCFIVVLLVIRCWIAISLLVFGSIFLAGTLSIVELVLNAAALSFILGMDELIYETLAPVPTRLLVRDMKPLARPRGREWRGLTAIGPVNLGVALVALSCFFGLYVLPNLASMGDITEAVCGGFKDFVVSDSAVDLIIATGTANPYGQRSVGKPFARQAVHDVVTRGGALFTNKALDLARYDDFLTMQQAPVGELVDLFAKQVLANKCSDYAMSAPGALDTFRATLQDALGVDLATCADAAGHCHGESRLLRLVCPATCGCDDPHSGLYKVGVHEGCPRETCTATGTYADKLSALPCKDYSVPQLLGMPGWETIVTQWAATWTNMQPNMRRAFEEARLALVAHGCGALDLLPARMTGILCTSNTQFGSIKSYCPSTCNCTSHFAPECPTQCYDTNP